MLAGFHDVGSFYFGLFEDDVTPENLPTVVHYHDSHEFIFLLESGNELFVKDSQYYMLPNQMIFIPQYTVHNIFYKTGTKHRRFVLNFRHDYIADILCAAGGKHILDAYGERDFSVNVLQSSSFRRANAAFYNLLDVYNEHSKAQTKESEMRLRLHAAASLIEFHKLLEASSAYSGQSITIDLVKNVANYLSINYMENISLDKIEQQFFISKSYICHKFKEVIGISIVEFLHYIRIAQAQKMLMTEEYAIIEVCHKCGFNNLQHFYNIFRKVTGHAPGMFRKIKQNNQPR